ncbi:MAG TPA: alanine--tRNA ligase [Spirochaetota bacterium]|nr:alanine--tRNA ligase [Spirochaetota bacterium]HOD13394.1 alanine--tRNA ligase [Spirochaetota bacterium]HPG50303.1 alanine--tRNA ligase [Spirochaetota bacterium]HQL81546.1 alanine--tRNA ligase [Spirochaetota bacterium]
MLTVMDLRKSFIEFFREREHRIVPSSSLIPKDDPTLLFTTAGMVQFKPMFAGTVELEYTRAATVQKCLRTSDLENVGKTKRHLTFFEMLGNFSFGDYFKEEAIQFAWDFSTTVIGFPKEKIWVSIYEDDDEARDIWRDRIGIPENKIVRLGKADNFWGPAGDTGACGPCSELYIDRGEKYGCGRPDCKPGCECERFLEYWNLVFNQYNQDADGTLHPLPRPGIDTGMGLERLATLVQDVDSVYDTDEFKHLTSFVCEKAKVKYEGGEKVAVNIIAEHARALTFAISDGVYPSNDGRGYVLRRVLRRAMRFSRQLGITEPFICSMVDPVIGIMQEFYPELKEAAAGVKRVIESEEQRFLETLENGMNRLEEIMGTCIKKKEKIISGNDAFLLYDTFGFPLEMTREMALERGLDVDMNGYEQEMEKQRERGKQSWKASSGSLEDALEEIGKKAGDSVFRGYESVVYRSGIELLHDGSAVTDRLAVGTKGLVVLKETSFYGESGGQVGDIGTITAPSGASFRVEDTKKINRTIIHMGEVVSGEFRTGDEVEAAVDVVNRNLIRANHSVTHLLHAALRSVLGTHVRQAGSLVAPERMRFDFTHFNAMTAEEIRKIEEIVNRKIWENIPVMTEIMNYQDAVKTGAMAVFDEKYEDTVRVISVPGFSKELCGGTHVTSTGQIGLFKILREASPGAGMRRIEAVTLRGVLERYNSYDGIIAELAKTVNVAESAIVKRVDELMKRTRQLEKEIEKMRKETITSDMDSLVAGAVDAGGVKIISRVFDGVGVDELRGLSDAIRSKTDPSVVLFGSNNGDTALLLFAATAGAVKKGIDCGAIIKDAVKCVGGGGGGRKDMAQAGGKNPAGLADAIQTAVERARVMAVS